MKRPFRLGKILEADRWFEMRELAQKQELWFELTEQDLERMLFITGNTGSGKSRLIRQLAREHIAQKLPLIVADPDGDTVEDILADIARKVAETGNTAILKRVHYLDPTNPFQLFGYHPFRFFLAKAVHPELMQSARICWQHAQVDRVSEIFQGKQGQTDFEGMPRLQRVLRNVLYCVATLVDGKQMALSEAEVLLDLYHPYHERVYAKLKPKLPASVVGDFEVLHGFTRVEEMRRESESTLNRLRSFLSPSLRAIFSKTKPEEVVDLFNIIQRGEILLVNLRVSPYWSRDQAVGFGQLVMQDIFNTLQNTPREMRKAVTIICEEASVLISDKLEAWLARGRKYGGRLVVCNQDLSGWRKVNGFDMTSKVLSCGTSIAFNTKHPDDVEILSRVQCMGNLDFTPLKHEVDSHEGYEFLQIQDSSYSVSKQTNKSRTTGTTQTNTDSAQQTQSTSNQTNTTRGSTEKYKDGSIQNADLGRSVVQGSGSGSSSGSSSGQSQAVGSSNTESAGESAGQSVTISNKTTPLSKIVKKEQKTGKLEHAVNDQLAEWQAKYPTLKRRQAIVKIADQKEAFVMETVDVPDAFTSQEAQAKAIEWVKRELYQLHPYFFTPDLDPREEGKRLEEFLSDSDDPVISPVEHTDERYQMTDEQIQEEADGML